MPQRLRHILIAAVAILIPIALLPPLLIAKARITRSEKPRIHLVPDMDNQPRFETQTRNRLFADRRAMRPPVEGAVARDRPEANEALRRGKVGETWVTEYPLPVTRELIERGRERYDVFCAACHGLAGEGNGPTAIRAQGLQEGTWVPPTSFHTETMYKREVGHLYNTIANGIRKMPAYGPQIPPEDRWAIVLYMRALQRSQRARVDDVPPDQRNRLR